MDFATVSPPLGSNATFGDVIFKALPKPINLSPPVADDIIEDDSIVNDGNLPADQDSSSSTYMAIFLPIVAVILTIALAAAIRWRTRITRPSHANGKCQISVNNNDISKVEGGIFPATAEETVPLKTRKASTSAVSRDILIEGSRPISVNMRIVSDETDVEILKSSRTDSYCRLSAESKPLDEFRDIPDSVTLECELLKEKTTDISAEGTRSKAAETERLTQESRPDVTCAKRPKTLQVMAIVDGNKATANTNSSKGFPWTEQQWTPDAEVIYEDTGSPENSCKLQKEGQDCLFPLMGKGRLKMKPRGLLERRGSNVALTISLNNEGKTCASSPPSSKSPKPLVYLRTATAKLDPAQLHIKAADASRLQLEFWEIPMNHPSEKHFSIPGYGTKNRYRSILPNPHSRVLLPASPGGDPLSSYINANYVRGYTPVPTASEGDRRRQSEDGKENEDRRMSMKRKAGFIATQGPMANTIVDFWKMVWQENATSIVMITKLKERKEKCSEYLPTVAGERQTYEQFEVTTVDVKYADHYTVRTLEVCNSEEKDVVHTVMHFWYAEWLDHETPDKLRSLLTLVQAVSTRSPDADYGPVVVHCSAGIGRTGCFIAIHIGCRQLRAEGKVDPLRIICQLRMDRGGMIQTWEQYQYFHVALSRYARLLAGENCNTPLTGSSAQTPDSRGSSRHSTPISGGGSDYKSPQTSRLLFSPRLYTKPDLTTVVESESGAGVDDNTKSPPKSDDSVPVLSSQSTQRSQNSRFSFSCAGDQSVPLNLGTFAPNDATNPSEGAEGSRGTSSSKRTKTSAPSPSSLKLDLKVNPVLDKMANGHCEVVEPEQIGSKANEANPAPKYPIIRVDGSGAAASYDFDKEDLGKLENILSPSTKEHRKTTTEEQGQNSSTFTFPAMEK